jgi:hypothetical protein
MQKGNGVLLDLELLLWSLSFSQSSVLQMGVRFVAGDSLRAEDKRACLTGPGTCLGPSNNQLTRDSPTSSMAVNEFFILYYFFDFFKNI